MQSIFSVGAKLRALRKERELSQRDLAELSGLSPNTVSLIERDEISPSVATLQHLAGALGVRMSYFFDAPTETSVVFARAGTRPHLTSEGVTIEALGARLNDQQVDPFYLTLAPHSGAGARDVVHKGQEFVCCLRGRVEYEVDGAIYNLDPGDFLLFQAELPHSWRNPGEETAELLLVLQASDSIGPTVRGHFSTNRSVEYLG